MNPSQIDIAKLTGFSHATVSRALAGSRLISEETRRKVVEAAERLGYRPNAVVSNLMALLRANRSAEIRSAIAYVTFFRDGPPEKINRNYALYQLGAKRRAEKLGYHLDVIWRTAPGMNRAKFSAILDARGIRGMVIAPRENPLGHTSMNWRDFAVAALGHPVLGPHLHGAMPNHLYNTQLALRHLHKLGYRRIGLILTPRQDGYFGSAVDAAFAYHQQRATGTPPVPPFLHLSEAAPEGDRAAKEWLNAHRPDALLCAGNLADRLVVAAGLTIPGDVALADFTMAEQHPDRAGIWERTEAVAAMAVDLVVEQLHHNELGLPAVAKSVQVEGAWVDGATAPHRHPVSGTPPAPGRKSSKGKSKAVSARPARSGLPTKRHPKV